MRTTHKTHRLHAGLTLVEMLIVLSIIAVLLTFFLPVLVKVRGAAQKAVCANNMRAIGQGVVHYAADNDGRLPYPGNAQMQYLSANYAWGGPGSPDNWFVKNFIDRYVAKYDVMPDNLRGNSQSLFYTTNLVHCPTMGRDGQPDWPESPLMNNPNFSYAFNSYIAGSYDFIPKGVTLSRVDGQAMLLTETRCGARLGMNAHVNGPHDSHAILNPPQYQNHAGPQYDGEANILYADGHVQAMSVADIPVMDPQDPTSLSAASRVFWQNPSWPTVSSD